VPGKKAKMKTIAFILLLGFSGPAAAGYEEAVDASTLNEAGDRQAKELDDFLSRPGAALAADARASALLAENQKALELFRQATAEPNGGYLFAPKPERLSAATSFPKYGPKVKLFKLLLIDAKIKAARLEPRPEEQDLLAAMAFMWQLSGQKAGVTLSSLVEQLCLQKAFPVLADSLRGAASPAYLKELAPLLDKTAANQDFMRAAMLEEGEIEKGSIQDAINPSTMAKQLKKVPLWKRFVVKKLQDKEFYDLVYRQFDAAVDGYTLARTTAFRHNDPAPLLSFRKKLQEEMLAHKKAGESRGQLAQFFDGVKGGAETKRLMAEAMTDFMLNAAMPSFEKLIPRYHLFFCQLGVLRSALAVKLYQRARRRLPDSLAQLVPAQLAAVPQDSFNKFAPLSYVRTGKRFLVYSYGPDGEDDKGAAVLNSEAYYADPASSAGDIVFAQ
jgi:uncharacterized protein (DUF1778 family)